MHTAIRTVTLAVLLFALSACSQDISNDRIIGDVDYTLIANEGSIGYVDGFDTQTYAFNDQVPGPLIEARVGEPLSVRAINRIGEPITIHWHGMIVPNAMDGVPGVTQAAIDPGEDFVYAFTPREPGFYWYHSHVDAHKQVEMGLQGPMIVRDANETAFTDSETVLVIDDVAVDEYGRYASFEPNYMHGRFGNVLLVNGQQDPLIEVQGESHRFRIVNTANARSFNLRFGGENITVIGDNIGWVEPYDVRTLTMHPGDRYDVIVSTNGSFGITQVTSRGSQRMASVSVSEKRFESVSHDHAFSGPNETLPDEAWTMEPTYRFDLRGARDPQFGLVWNIGGANDLTNPRTFEVEAGSNVKIRLTNTQGQPHPMHLHGQKFMITARDGVPVDQKAWKDTVMVAGGETVDIAFVAGEEGEWVFHCHILEHAKAGMLTSITVA